MKKLLTMLALGAVLTASVAAQTPAPAPAPAQDAAAKELAAIQGVWLVTSMNGQDPADQGGQIGLSFTGNKYQVLINGTVDESGTFKLDPSKKPMSFDLTILEGNDAGKLQLGIVEIKGDIAQGMLGQPGSTVRPADFNSNDGAVLFIAKKVK